MCVCVEILVALQWETSMSNNKRWVMVTLRKKFCLNTRKRKAPLKTTTAMRDI